MSISLPSNPLTSGLSGTQALHTELTEIKQEAAKSIEKALTLFGTVNAGGAPVNANGSPSLTAPKSIVTNVSDLTLRIALMQDALDQLMQEVSKNEIKQRLNELNRENQEHLAKVKEQLKEAEKSAQKAREAAQKTNIFKAIANFFKALVDFIVGVFTAVAAIGYALTGNVVAAAGLFVASAALFASSAVNLIMAVDSMVAAAKGSDSGFLNEKALKGMQKTVEILGYVAMAAGMLGGLGAAISGIQSAVKTAAGKALDSSR